MPRSKSKRSNEVKGVSKKGITGGQVIAWIFLFIVVDILGYGLSAPVLGTYAGSILTRSLNLSPRVEVPLVIICVFVVLLVSFRLKLEKNFWKHFFAEEPNFGPILYVRDFGNVLMIIFFLDNLMQSINAMIGDHKMKEKNLSEGVFYVLLKPFASDSVIETFLPPCVCHVFQKYETPSDIDQSESYFYFVYLWFRMLFTFNQSPSVAIVCDSCLRTGPYIHGAEFIFAVATLTAVIIKAVYFNTLYAYMLAIQIFNKMDLSRSKVDNDRRKSDGQWQEDWNEYQNDEAYDDEDYEYFYDKENDDPVLIPKSWLANKITKETNRVVTNPDATTTTSPLPQDNRKESKETYHYNPQSALPAQEAKLGKEHMKKDYTRP